MELALEGRLKASFAESLHERLLAALYAEAAVRGFAVSAKQLEAMRLLAARSSEHFALHSPKSPSWWRRCWPRSLRSAILPKDSTHQGVYLWGGVGRGKTFVMDLFFRAFSLSAKMRLHRHELMSAVHKRLRALQGLSDPLDRVAEELSQRALLICVDEFAVEDIADAMILGRLLDALWLRGVFLVLTSNAAPNDLYRNGLQRERFLPTIAKIEARMQVFELDDGVDYRRVQPLWSEDETRYFLPDTAESDVALARLFQQLTGFTPQPKEISINDRALPVRAEAQGVIWCDFEALCGKPRAYEDYLTISSRYRVVFLSHLPFLDTSRIEEARRLVWLIDSLYDRGTKLYLSASALPEEVDRLEGRLPEFQRTISRLNQMGFGNYRSGIRDPR